VTRTIAFDPGALLRLDVARTVADDGQEQLVEAILHRLDDGRFRLMMLDDGGDAVGSVTLRSDFLTALSSAAQRAAA
jgi:hypothetical protein